MIKKEQKTTGNRFASTANEMGVAKLNKKGQEAKDRLNGSSKAKGGKSK